ncbi:MULTISPECIES: hypothetical protein [Streptomyces]|uniref:hypothetical protein n=1 Tax=Streptomyces TaxID=1883 RepID=UPI0036B579FE
MTTALDRARRVLDLPPVPAIPGQMTAPHGLRIGSVCSGYRGLDAAVETVLGGTTAWVSDIDPGSNGAGRPPSIPPTPHVHRPGHPADTPPRRHPMTTDLTITETVTVTVNCFDVELDNGEDLRGLDTGCYLELAEPVAGMTPGTWQVVAWQGDDLDAAVMRPVSATEVLELRQDASEALAAVFAPAPSEETR